MPGDPEEDEFWHKPVWETEDEESLDPLPSSSAARVKRPPSLISVTRC
jgi:hypothetical protein